MTAVLPSRVRGRLGQPPAGVPRLLAGLDGAPRMDLRQHLDHWGIAPPLSGPKLLADVDASGLVGHGGAWFPVGRKWKAVASAGRRRPVVVANGAEGEPLSMKDALLLTRAPHLVLDGATAAAAAVGACRVVVYVHPVHAGIVGNAIEERRRAGVDRVAMEVALAPEVFLAGQESAAVNVINRRAAATPSFVTVRSVRERGVENRPTLVQNVETLAHVALIARFGAPWFRELGTGPGTMLLTVHGAWSGSPRVLEVPIGAPAADVLGLDAASAGAWRGALLGGYGGGWVSMDTVCRLPLTEQAARQAGATLGAGIVALLPQRSCPVAEVARVAAYMRDQSAGQCGPCVNGLSELAVTLQAAAYGRPRSRAAGPRRDLVARLLELCDLVDGRGACKHPDGVARMVRSACAVFGDHLAAHLDHGPCPEAERSAVLPVPSGVAVEGRRLQVRR